MSELPMFDPTVGGSAYLHGPALVAALAAFGLIVGVLTGLFGVGGGFMITPLLRVLLGVPYEIAVGSGLAFILGTSSAGAVRHGRQKNLEPRTVLVVGLGSMLGAVVGGRLMVLLKRAVGDGEGFTLTMHGLFMVLLLVTAWLVARRPGQDGPEGPSLLARLPLGPRIDLPTVGLSGISVPGLVGVGLGIGVLTGLLGIGGGVLMMPLLLLVVGMQTRQAVGTSLGVVLLASLAGTGEHAWSGHVNLVIALSLLLGSAIGVQIGAWLCEVLHAQAIRRYFAVLVLLVALAIAADFVHKLMT